MVVQLTDGKIKLSYGDIEMLADELEETMGITVDDNDCVDSSVITVEELQRLQIKYYAANHWYPLLHDKDITMNSILVPLTKDQINNIIAKRDCPEFLQYIKQVNNNKVSNSGVNNKVFVKLGSVSPKDTSSLTAMTSQQIVNILASSPRVVSNLTNPDWPNQYLFLRDYWSFVPSSPEFRVFVTGRRCVAISQDNFVECGQSPDTIKAEIVKFCSKVIDLLWYEDCTIDVVYCSAKLRYYLIEINTPYYLIAGTALYNLDVDSDRGILSGLHYNEFGTDIRFPSSWF